LDNGKENTLDSNSSNVVPQSIGGFLFGAFHIVTIVMLINMLIAMMTKSYERIRVSYYYFGENILFKIVFRKLLMLNGNLQEQNYIWNL
jgi:hypothetical protein